VLNEVLNEVSHNPLTKQQRIGNTVLLEPNFRMASAAMAREREAVNYREFFEHNPLAAVIYDRETLAFLAVNEAATRLYGWTREEFSSLLLIDLVCLDEPRLSCGDLATIDHAHRIPGCWRHQAKSGADVTVDISTCEIEYLGRPARLCMIRDLTEHEKLLEEYRAGEQRWQLALRGAGDAMWDWNIATGRVFRSPRWWRMLGYADGEIGDSYEEWLRLLNPDDVESTLEALDLHLSRRSPEQYCAEYRMLHKDGSWVWVMDRGKAVWDENGIPVRMAGSHTDITDRKAAESVLTMQARTDALTGVANRREFERLFNQHFRTCHYDSSPLSVCLCDLDHFKEVNDEHGHATGDKVLATFAGILRSHLRDSDVIARLGGDEFVIALPCTSAATASRIVERIRAELRAVSFESAPGPFRVTGSFGVAELRTSHRTVCSTTRKEAAATGFSPLRPSRRCSPVRRFREPGCEPHRPAAGRIPRSR
jgi:diguanylate cyclase (GGDEF)-like protein/PAS domain S-box-containing protein